MSDYSELIKSIKFNEDGLIPAVAQDVDTGEVVMVAYMNDESLKKTIKEKKACYFSRSRQKLWTKGEHSGSTQEVKKILIDCDLDTILLKIKQSGGACHLGYYSCFFREINDNGELEIIAEKVLDKKETYKA
ncbi:phosphoribosyl-AMP cyclohydrolase [candidate division KSB1 bacterium]